MFYQNPYYDPSKIHHTPTGFQNPEPFDIPLARVLKWAYLRWKTQAPPLPNGGYGQFITDWVIAPDLSHDYNFVSWLGHCTLYFKWENLGIMTDPMFSERASFINWAGPQRRTPALVDVKDITLLHYVLISHEHYDHLDLTTIQQLLVQFPELTFIVPLGLERWFHKKGITKVIALDWWDEFVIDHATKITAVPAQHWSNRHPFAKNRSLWCGYMISRDQHNHYFAGDTAYAECLLEIGERFDIDYGYLPIGSYAPEWFMKYQHISPEDVVRLHHELFIQKSIGIHWGVFEMGDENFDEAPHKIKKSFIQYPGNSSFLVVPINTSMKIE